ncbi:hypothetical protein JL722_5069 [Aureococcus anophagefferens]|nr:hypothetical protein JL722_5069 [Aureococcus anophagefferens]
MKALGVPWAARVAIAKSKNAKKIAHEGRAWVEATTTAVVTKTQTLCLDGSEQKDTNPVDRSVVSIWSAVGGRPAAAPPRPRGDDDPAPEDGASPRLPPAPAVVTVMHDQKTGNVSTITRTLEDGGDTPSSAAPSTRRTSSPSTQEEEALEKALGAFDEVDEDLVEEDEEDEEAAEDAAAEDDAEAAEDADDASAADDGVVDEDALLPEDERAINAFVGDDGDDDGEADEPDASDGADGAAAPAPAPSGGTRPLTEEEKREKKLARRKKQRDRLKAKKAEVREGSSNLPPTVYVRAFHGEFEKKDLRTVFDDAVGADAVARIRIVGGADARSGAAFVELSDAAHVPAALALNRTAVGDLRISVKPALDKKGLETVVKRKAAKPRAAKADDAAPKKRRSSKPNPKPYLGADGPRKKKARK